MLILISPAKKLDPSPAIVSGKLTMPEFLDQSQILIRALRKYSADEIAEFMKLSPTLAELNFERFKKWRRAYTKEQARTSLLTFNGEVYAGMNANTFSAADRNFAQKHLRILSGLYGLLRPLDLILPYRLEMGKKLETKRGGNLYEFWGDRIIDAVNAQLKAQKDDVLINLASKEYIKAAKLKFLKGRVITPEFKERKGDGYKMIGVFAKQARGKMCRFIIQNRLKEVSQLRDFDVDGYAFNKKLSADERLVFTRG